MAVSTNPATLLGFGTWAAYAEGRVLVGFQSSGTFDALDESLGAETASASTTGSHTLSIAEMPAHTHTTVNSNSDSGSGKPASGGDSPEGAAHTSESTGGGEGHTHTTPAVSTLQPSKTLYIWKRTA